MRVAHVAHGRPESQRGGLLRSIDRIHLKHVQLVCHVHVRDSDPGGRQHAAHRYVGGLSMCMEGL